MDHLEASEESLTKWSHAINVAADAFRKICPTCDWFKSLVLQFSRREPGSKPAKQNPKGRIAEAQCHNILHKNDEEWLTLYSSMAAKGHFYLAHHYTVSLAICIWPELCSLVNRPQD